MGRKPPLHFRKFGNGGAKIEHMRSKILTSCTTKIRPAKYGIPELAGRKFWGNLIINWHRAYHIFLTLASEKLVDYLTELYTICLL